MGHTITEEITIKRHCKSYHEGVRYSCDKCDCKIYYIGWRWFGIPYIYNSRLKMKMEKRDLI